jgi:hypothetical protein
MLNKSHQKKNGRCYLGRHAVPPCVLEEVTDSFDFDPHRHGFGQYNPESSLAR